MPDQEPTTRRVLTGNILFFYAYDVGDEIDLDCIKHKELLPVRAISPSPFFKNYHLPLTFDLPSDGESDCIFSRVHHFGVISLCYKVPYEGTLDEVERIVIEAEETYGRRAERDAKRVYDALKNTVKGPRFYHLKNSYFVLQLDPIREKISAEEFKEQYAGAIARLLRLETKKLSDYQKDDILRTATGYYGQDLIVIDSEASFVYDQEYEETIEFFELALIQQLELQYFDRLLYRHLNTIYAEGAFRIPIKAYIPLVGRALDLPISRLARLKVDITVITEQLENSIKLVGDAYYSNLYSMLGNRLGLPGWKESVQKKMSIIDDLYSHHQAHLDGFHSEMLEIIIIILIALEAYAAFVR